MDDEKIEVFCQNSTTLFSLGYTEYSDYKKKCAEHNAVLAIPGENDIFWNKIDSKGKKIWTGIERTGPHPGIVVEFNCYLNTEF